jgi:hypothetical protein
MAETGRLFKMFDVEHHWATNHPDLWPSMMLCLFTGDQFPQFCAAMERDPVPPVGQVFTADFPALYARILAINPATHDGAVMIGRLSDAENYRIAGWSFRLFPPQSVSISEANRGSAFNSCLEMSQVKTVERSYLFSQRSLIRFERGSVCIIQRQGTAVDR